MTQTHTMQSLATTERKLANLFGTLAAPDAQLLQPANSK